jgi:Myb-like DNA-binding protein FlbD
MIEQLVHEMGKRWAEIARRLGNRSDNAVKNWWNGSMNRRKRSNIQQTASARGVGPRSGPMPATHSLSLRGDDRHPYASHLSAVHIPDVTRPIYPQGLPTPDRECSQDPFRPTLPEVRTLPGLSQPFTYPPAMEPSPDPFPAHRSLHTPRSSLDFKLAPFDWRSRATSEKPLLHAAISPAATEYSHQQVPSLVSDTHSRDSISPKMGPSPRPGLPAPIKTTPYYYDHRRRTSHVSVTSDGKVHTPLDEGYMSALPTSTTMLDGNTKRFPFDLNLNKSLFSPSVERRPEFHLPLPKLSPLSERDHRMNVARLLD